MVFRLITACASAFASARAFTQFHCKNALEAEFIFLSKVLGMSNYRNGCHKFFQFSYTSQCMQVSDKISRQLPRLYLYFASIHPSINVRYIGLIIISSLLCHDKRNCYVAVPGKPFIGVRLFL